MKGVVIHPTAIIEAGAEFGTDVHIGPYCIVSGRAKLGDRTRLQSHVVIDGDVAMGSDNQVFPFSMIGGPPQDLTYKGEPTRVVIGDRNVFREQCTVHRGTLKDKGITRIGNDGFFMATSHFAHDSFTGNHVIFANYAAIAGHCEVHDYAFIGGQTAVIQHCRVGAHCFVGANSVVRKDIPPYLCGKDFSKVTGPNLIGMKRKGVSDEDIKTARSLYKLFYLESQRTEEALQLAEERFPLNPFVGVFLDFVRTSKVGIQR